MLNRRFLPILALCVMSTVELCAADGNDHRFSKSIHLAVCNYVCEPGDHSQFAKQNKATFREIQENPELRRKFFKSSCDALECGLKQMTEEEISFVEEDRTAFDEEPVSCFPGTRFAFQTIRKNVPWLCSALCCLVGTATVCNNPCCCASCAGIAVVPHVLHKMKKQSLPIYRVDELATAVSDEIAQRKARQPHQYDWE